MSESGSGTTGFLVVDLARLFRQNFERAVALEGLELTAGEARTLLHASNEERVRQNVLAKRMRVEPMTLTNFLERLERRGLIARETDPGDRRAKQVRITLAAEPLVARIREISAAVRQRATAGLTSEDVERLQRTLQVMRNNLSDEAESRAA
jgi:MarR family transcriptional regulator, transcriptional regulator for hemolysin